MASATLTSKWQMVIPKPIREHLRVQPGDQVDFVIRENGEVIVQPATHDVKELKGIFSRPGMKRVSVEEMNAAIRKRARRLA